MSCLVLETETHGAHEQNVICVSKTLLVLLVNLELGKSRNTWKDLAQGTTISLKVLHSPLEMGCHREIMEVRKHARWCVWKEKLRKNTSLQT